MLLVVAVFVDRRLDLNDADISDDMEAILALNYVASTRLRPEKWPIDLKVSVCADFERPIGIYSRVLFEHDRVQCDMCTQVSTRIRQHIVTEGRERCEHETQCVAGAWIFSKAVVDLLGRSAWFS